MLLIQLPRNWKVSQLHWLIHLWKWFSFLLIQGISQTNVRWVYKAFFGSFQVDQQWPNTTHLKSARNQQNILDQSTVFLILISFFFFFIFTVKRIEQIIPRVPSSSCSQWSMCQSCGSLECTKVILSLVPYLASQIPSNTLWLIVCLWIRV